MNDSYERSIEFIETKEHNFSITVENMLVHSKYFPKKEAKSFIDNLSSIYENKKTIVIYGLGLGYHISELLSRLDEDCKVIIFDLDEELFKFTRHNEVIKEIINDNRVEVNIGYSEAFFSIFSEALNEVEDLILYKSSLRILPECFQDFKNIIERFIIEKIALESFGEMMKENKKSNLLLNSQKIDEYLNKVELRGKDVLIVSAGPSLDKEIENIRRMQKHVIVFAVGSSLKHLIINGIKPDMFCIIDAQEIVYDQIKGHEDLDIPLCFLATASHTAIKNYKGPKYMFLNEVNGDDIIIETGKSVATALISISIKAGAKRIMLVGQDLAYLENKTHCSNYPHSNNNAEFSKIFKTVIGISGNTLNTTPGLLYFKNWIENVITLNPQIEFINCSSGAKIKGTSETRLAELLNDYLESSQNNSNS